MPTRCLLTLLITLATTALATSEPWDGELPAGWVRGEVVVLPAEQLDTLGKRFGGELTSIENLHFTYRGLRCQVNRIVCATKADAASVKETLTEFKGDPHLVRLHSEDARVVLELYCPDAAIARLAKTAFEFRPKKQLYRVEFLATPLERYDDMKWNALFNWFLEYDLATDAESRFRIEAAITELTANFKFSSSLRFRNTGQGDRPICPIFDPPPANLQVSEDGAFTVYEFADLPKKAGVPVVKVSLWVESEHGAVSPAKEPPSKADRSSTPWWPTSFKFVRSLAKSITKDAESDRNKVTAILAWMANPQNLRYGGEIPGSRHGVKQTLEQKYGHCWDYSDVFITLCRASGVPSRQVLGWLHGVSGHVWCEAYIDGAGWRAFDPTGSPTCGSDYVPYFGGSDGRATFAYASEVKVTPLDPVSDQLRLELRALEDGSRPNGLRFESVLHNTGSKTVTVVRPGDGSDDGWRTPVLRWTPRSPTGGRCGNQNALTSDEVLDLAPGDHASMRDWIGSPNLDSPGRQTVKLEMIHEPDHPWIGLSLDTHDPKAMRRLRNSRPYHVTSNALVIEVDDDGNARVSEQR